MKIYGPFRGLSDPLVVGELGLQGLSSAISLYKEYQQGQQNKLLVQSLLSGKPVVSEPGSAVRHFASDITGGLISLDVDANPTTLLAERSGMAQQQQAKLKGLASLAAIRNNVGSGPFQPGSTFDTEAQQYGAPPGIMSGPTNKETTDKRLADAATRQAENSTPQAKAAVAGAEQQEREDVTYSPQNMARAIGLKNTEAENAASIQESRALNTFNAEKAEAPAIAAATQSAKDRQKDTDFDNQPLSRYKMKTGTTFVDGSLNEVNKPNMTVGAAASNPDLTPVLKGKQAEQVADVRGAVQRLKKLDGLIDKVYPDTTGMNSVAANKALLEAGTKNWWNKYNDKNVNAFYQAKLDTVEIIKRANGRFPNQKELDIPLLPDPGGLESYGTGIMGGLKGAVPSRSDSREVAHAKIQSAIERLTSGTSALIKNDSSTGDTATDDDDETGSAIDKTFGGSPEP